MGDEIRDTYDRGLKLYHQGRYAEAVPLFEQTLSLSEARYGADDPAVASDLNNLAEVYRLTGRREEAEALYLRAIELDKKRDPPDPASLATSYNNLALVYREQDRLQEAEQLYERALAVLEKELGGSHPNVARNLNNLAMVYAAQGNGDRARTLLDRAVSIAKDVLGPMHPTTIALSKNRDALINGDSVPDLPPPDVPPPEMRPAEVRLAGDPQVAGRQQADTPPPRARPAASLAAAPMEDEFVIHLASVSSADAVDAAWRRLSSLYQLPKSIRQVPAERIEVQGQGMFYRVAGGGFASLDEAKSVCRAIRQRGEYCQVIIAN